jgi:hypothetical protein
MNKIKFELIDKNNHKKTLDLEIELKDSTSDEIKFNESLIENLKRIQTTINDTLTESVKKEKELALLDNNSNKKLNEKEKTKKNAEEGGEEDEEEDDNEPIVDKISELNKKLQNKVKRSPESLKTRELSSEPEEKRQK